MKGWISRALIIAVIIVIIQAITGQIGLLEILVALVIGFIFSGIAEGISKLTSGKKK